MSHFAKVDKGVVIKVITVEEDFFENFIDTSPGEWIQTSYNTRGGVHIDSNGKEDGGIPIRKNFAGAGYIYDKDRDAFYEPQPYLSWVLNEDTCLWEPPVAYPDDDKMYEWDEETTSWVEVNVN